MPKYSSFKKQQTLTENFRRFLSEGEYEDEDESYEIDPLTGDQKVTNIDRKTDGIDNPYGYNLISDWTPEKLKAAGEEDGYASNPDDSEPAYNPLYREDAKYPGDSSEDREFKKRLSVVYRDAYDEAVAERDSIAGGVGPWALGHQDGLADRPKRPAYADNEKYNAGYKDANENKYARMGRLDENEAMKLTKIQKIQKIQKTRKS